jgi:hypothetical protein
MILLVISGCGLMRPRETQDNAALYPVASPFEAFLVENDMQGAFGPALEPARVEGSITRQTFLAAELEHDAEAERGQQVQLTPLGTRLGLAEPPVPPGSDPEARYFSSTGHFLYPGFLQRYEELGGETLLGPPIAEAKSQGGKIFQYFENVGMYREEDAPPHEVGLLALGAAGRPELSPEVREAREIVLPPSIVFQPFGAFIEPLGGETLFGPPLTEPYLAPDGALEQVYERAVIYSEDGEPESASLRRLGAALGPADPPVLPADEPDAFFFEETGHNVRWALAEFYRSHQGEVILGLPLEEANLSDGKMTQRYEKGVLEYHYDLPPELAFQLAPLGKQFLEAAPEAPANTGARPWHSQATREPASSSPPAAIQLKTWPLHPAMGRGEQQIIYIEARNDQGEPLAGIIPLIAIYRQGGELYPPLSATDVNGMTSLSLSPIEFQPGEIVNYEVVAAGESGYGYAWGQFAVLLGTPWP